ncbi:MAG: hypothetical protein ACT4PT_05990 [Methanobacteriota archaeon]
MQAGATGAEVHENDIVGNEDAGVKSGGPAVDAEGNWWGCPEGPSDPACDAGAWPDDAEPWAATHFP